ncbi:MAG: L-fuconate dehydratase [Planctomycetales bacterium]|nr:L-fuconate dehydratase [Planctomycetales bacterium]
MSVKIEEISVRDIRFPTSRERHGSDAMNPDPDYSAVYVTIHTNGNHTGNGIAFTLGRGTELCAAAAERVGAFIVGQTLELLTADMGKFWRTITSDSQLRWLGPDKGIIHLATAAIVNAVWDLWAKTEHKPLWKLLTDMSPKELVRCIDFRYITDAITPDQAIEILAAAEPTKPERIARLRETGVPAYTTSAGWLGYSDEKIQHLCTDGIENGWAHFKVKVGANLEQDIHRLQLVRDAIGPDLTLMTDANQVWDVAEAIEYMGHLARFEPWWIEEPTSPDDILGHAAISKAIAPIGVASGEMCQNRILFKQFLQASAIQFCQIDSCRVGGVNEVLAIILMAKKFGVPVCPHGGGVGLCEHIQHLSIFDAVSVSQSIDDRVTEYVDHLHEHFLYPCKIDNGAYVVPEAPGYSIEMHEASLEDYSFPDGPVWQDNQ